MKKPFLTIFKDFFVSTFNQLHYVTNSGLLEVVLTYLKGNNKGLGKLPLQSKHQNCIIIWPVGQDTDAPMRIYCPHCYFTWIGTEPSEGDGKISEDTGLCSFSNQQRKDRGIPSRSHCCPHQNVSPLLNQISIAAQCHEIRS